MRFCMNHPLVETDRYCSRCKKPVCGDCLVPLKGQEVCAECKHATLAKSFKANPVHAPAAPAWTPAPAPSPVAPGEVSPAPEAAWASPVAELSAAYAAAPVLGNCAYHPNSPAYTTCERCGDFTCALCVTAFEGRNYCVRCLDLMWQRGALEASRFTQARTTLIFGVIGAIVWIVPFYGIIPGFVALGLGVGALRRIAAQPELPGKKQALIGTVLGALGVLCSIGFWVWVIMRGFQ